MAYQTQDPEKAPLMPSETTTPTPVDDAFTTNDPPTPEHLATLHASLLAAAESYRTANTAYQTAWSRTPSGRFARRFTNGILILFGGLGAFMISALLMLTMYAALFDPDDTPYVAPRKVQLEAHIMSKCPDARDCLRDLVLPAMQNVSSFVDFKLSYIGKITDEKDGQGEGVLCMHGPGECLGDIIELCAADLYPDPKIHLGFAMCLTRQYEEIPDGELVRDCALEHGISFEKLNGCVSRDDGYGVGLLKDSVLRTKEANVSKSCTIRLDGEVRCIRDGGAWSDCEGGSKPVDLVKDIMAKRYTQA